jgi:hypothetical protein
MAKENETNAEIIAEKRREANYIVQVSQGKCQTRRDKAEDEARDIRREADRLEAAYKRERGNCAKLREALETVRKYVKETTPDKVMLGVIEVWCDEALAAPARNCDLFNFDDAEENARAAWDAFDGTLELNMAELSPREYAIVKECMAAFRWLFSHYKRQSESAKKALAATEKEGDAK